MTENEKINNSFFNQPRGLMTLSLTEMWERFSYYGMRAILLFYMYFAIKEGGLGFDQATAASIMSIYGALVYMSSVAGGWLSDRILGNYKTVFLGGFLIMLGHISLAVPYGKYALYLSIIFIVIGTGLLKPNIASMVGDLYSINDKRRDVGFNIYTLGINIGAVLAPWLVPWAAHGLGLNILGATAHHYNFHIGFALAAIGMFIGLLQYGITAKKYCNSNSFVPKNPIKDNEISKIKRELSLILVSILFILLLMFISHSLKIKNVISLITCIAIILPVIYFTFIIKSKKTSTLERKRVYAYIPLFIIGVIFWGIQESGSVIIALFAQQRTILHIGNWHFTAANFQTLDPIIYIILVPIFVYIWDHWKNNQPSTPTKFSIGLILAGASFAFLAIPTIIYGNKALVSPFWIVGSITICMLGDVLINPIGLSITSKLAPKAYKSQMMSLWLLADAAGQAVNAQLVKFYNANTEISYFLIIGFTAIIIGVICLCLVKPIKKLMCGIN